MLFALPSSQSVDLNFEALWGPHNLHSSFFLIQIVNNNLEHISGVLLIQSSKIIGISDQYGKINIDTSSKELDNLFLSHKNYYQKELTTEILKRNTTIILTKKINTFDPIVVSGGRNIRYKNDIALLSQRIDKKKIGTVLNS